MDKTTVFNALVKKLRLFQLSPTIYEAIGGFIEFGPYGSSIKSNIVATIKKEFRKAGFWEVEHPIIMPLKVWEASGHAERFLDIIAESDGKTYRVDKVIEEDYPSLILQERDIEGVQEFLLKNQIIPKGNKTPLTNPREYKLMMMANVADEEGTLRPETATATYSSFKEYYDLFRNHMPLKVFQFGRVFRNEITARQGLLRSREFEQIEGQIFLLQNDIDKFKLESDVSNFSIPLLTSNAQLNTNHNPLISLDEALSNNVLNSEAYAYCFVLVNNVIQSVGLSSCEVRFRQHLPTEKAHYAIDAWDVELKTDQFGWIEICGVHDRGSYDLMRHQEYSGKKLSILNINGQDEIPHILEIAFGVGRVMYSLLESSFNVKDEKNRLSLPYHISPIDVAIFPLVKKDGLTEIALQLNRTLLEEGFTSVFDEKGSIGKRYARMDEIGTSFCITIDYDFFDDQTVTIRERDSGKQERLKLVDVGTELRKRIKK